MVERRSLKKFWTEVDETYPTIERKDPDRSEASKREPFEVCCSKTGCFSLWQYNRLSDLD